MVEDFYNGSRKVEWLLNISVIRLCLQLYAGLLLYCDFLSGRAAYLTKLRGYHAQGYTDGIGILIWGNLS